MIFEIINQPWKGTSQPHRDTDQYELSSLAAADTLRQSPSVDSAPPELSPSDALFPVNRQYRTAIRHCMNHATVITQ